MRLSRTTSATLFEINSPVWNGGQKMVGLNRNRMAYHNEIRFTYRRKSDGELSLPDVYYFDGSKFFNNETAYRQQNIKGTQLVLVPFGDLELLERV